MMRARAAPDIPLLPVLSVLLPGERQTLFLRACLHRGDAGRSAWKAWAAAARDGDALVGRDGSVPRGLLPLLLAAVQQQGAAVERRLLSILRAARSHEELRMQTSDRVCANVLQRLSAAGVPVLVGKGTALASALYAEPALRHCHDIDLLVPLSAVPVAMRALEPLGIGVERRVHDSGRAGVRLRHGSGLPIELHPTPFRLAHHALPLSALFARSVGHPVAGVPSRIPATAHLLLLVCGHAATCASRDSLRWVSDAWHIVAGDADLDWTEFVRSVREARLTPSVLRLLLYLSEELDAPVPPEVLQELTASAARASKADHEAALTGARAGRRGTIRNMLREGSGRDRAIVLRWTIRRAAARIRSGRRISRDSISS